MKSKYLSYQLDQTDTTGSFPDLISQKPEVAKPRVGLLGCGWYEFWRMWPELEQRTDQMLNTIAQQLEACPEFDLIYPGMVDTMDSADQAGRTFARERIDLLVIAQGIYIPDYFVVHVKRYVDDVPMIAYVPQTFSEIPPDINYSQLMGDSGLVGLAQLTGAFAKAGWPYEVIVAPVGFPEVAQRIATRCKLLHLHRWLKFAKIGVYAHPFRGMFDIEYDKTKLQAAIGPESIYIEERNLVTSLAKVGEAETDELVEQVTGRFRTDPELPREKIACACRLTLALQRMVEDYRLDAMSLLSQYSLELVAQDNGCLASSLLLEQDCMVCCEGDTSTVVMMMIMKALTGHVPYYAEYTTYDLKENAFLFNHHGDGNPRLARSDQDIYLTFGPENWGCDSCALEFMVKPGTYTLGGLIDDAEGFKFLIARGEALDRPVFHIQSPQILFRPELPVREFFELVLSSGFRHHAAICPGDCVAELSQFADMVGARKLIL